MKKFITTTTVIGMFLALTAVVVLAVSLFAYSRNNRISARGKEGILLSDADEGWAEEIFDTFILDNIPLDSFTDPIELSVKNSSADTRSIAINIIMHDGYEESILDKFETKVVRTTDDRVMYEGSFRAIQLDETFDVLASLEEQTYAFEFKFIGDEYYHEVVECEFDIEIASDPYLTPGWHEGENGRKVQAHTAVEYNDKMYVFGGRYDEGSDPTDIRVYNLITHKWEESIPTDQDQVKNHTAVVHQDKMYVIFRHALTIYDFPSNSWTNGASLQPNLLDHTAVVGYDPNDDKEKMYVFGGLTGNGGVSKKMFIYDFETDTWTNGAEDEHGRVSHSAAEYNGNIYIFGGMTEEYAIANAKDVRVYNIENDTWTSEDYNGTLYRAHHNAVVVDDQMYVYGGYNPNAYQLEYDNNIQVYNFETKNWNTIEGGANARPGHNHSMTSYTNLIVIYGGMDYGAGVNYYDNVSIYITE